MGLVERREEILKLLISRRKSTVPILMHEFHVSEKTGSFANVGVVKSICKQVQTAAYQGSNHGISATGGFISHGYSFSGTAYLLSIDLRMCPMQSI